MRWEYLNGFIFVSLAHRAQTQQLQKHLKSFLRLALKAQAQSRTTISALVELKYPRQATFVKQANIAHGPQQINNGAAAVANPDMYAQARMHAGKSEPEQNKLLEAEHGQLFDVGVRDVRKLQVASSEYAKPRIAIKRKT